MADGERENTIIINARRFLRGRPARIDTPDDFLDLACGFFEECEENGQRPTVTGLALALGYCGRKGLDEAAAARGGVLRDAVKRAKAVVAMWREGQLGSGGGRDNGHIFVLKNMGWRDDQGREVRGGMNLVHEGLSPREAALALIAAAEDEGIEPEE